MSSRNHRATVASQTLSIVQGGTYYAPSGKAISIAASVQMAIHRTILITPRQTRALRSRADEIIASRPFATRFHVANETTLTAARRLVAQNGPDRVAALNFASAKNPGGGFLNGSQAQEESLARATALYPSLLTQRAYYDANRHAPTALYTDHMILSPQVPVFRDDDDQLLEEPWEVSIFTAPAPNAGAIASNHPDSMDDIEPTFRRRIEQLLCVATVHEQSALVLGAWGCGVFRNDPAMVAGLFAEFLLPGGPFASAFEHISFAVLDRHGDTFSAFAGIFGN
jgi:uncharacterized protein (TIGR02452 family)